MGGWGGEWEEDKAGKAAWGLKSLDSTLLVSVQLSFYLLAHLRGSQSLWSEKHSRGVEREPDLEVTQVTSAGLPGRVQLRACRVAEEKAEL